MSDSMSVSPLDVKLTNTDGVIEYRAPLPGDTSLLLVSEEFEANPDLQVIPVVDAADKPLGLVSRRTVNEIFARTYGRPLHGKDPVSKHIDVSLFVSLEASIDEASKALTEQTSDNWYFVIEKGGEYYAVGSVRGLLRELTDLRVEQARHANPLTHLPGNQVIAHVVAQRLAAQVEFRVIYFDVNDFKPYNDRYGYSRGDDVIRLLADLLREHFNRNSFLGHVGGDDFVVITTDEEWLQMTETVIQAFNASVIELTDVDDRQASGYWGVSRAGDKLFFPFSTLSAGVICPDYRYCSSPHEVAELAASAKKMAKDEQGNIYVCRRRSPNRLIDLTSESAA